MRLLSDEYDSINFSGPLFKEIKILEGRIGISESDSLNELFLSLISSSYFNYTCKQKDSIVSILGDSSRIDVYAKDKKWTLKSTF